MRRLNHSVAGSRHVEGLGIADIDKNGRIKRFVEKPLPKDAPSNLANTGLYVMSPELKKIFKEKGMQQIIKEKNRLDFGYDFIPYVIQTGRPVYGYTLKGSWFDVGTPKNYLEAMKNLLQRRFLNAKRFRRKTKRGEPKSGFRAKAATLRNVAKKSCRRLSKRKSPLKAQF